jgi:hypothetical protein
MKVPLLALLGIASLATAHNNTTVRVANTNTIIADIKMSQREAANALPHAAALLPGDQQVDLMVIDGPRCPEEKEVSS